MQSVLFSSKNSTYFLTDPRGGRQQLRMIIKRGLKLVEKVITQYINACKGSIKLYDQKTWITPVKRFIFCNGSFLEKWNFIELPLFHYQQNTFFIILMTIKYLVI